MDPTGFFSYEDIWLPGQFRATNPPREPVPAATAAGRKSFPTSRGSMSWSKSFRRKLPSLWWYLRLYPHKVAQPGTAEAAEREACNSALRRVVAGRPHSNFINYRIDNALTRDDANFMPTSSTIAPSLASRMSEGIADEHKARQRCEDRFLISPRLLQDPRTAVRATSGMPDCAGSCRW